MALWPSTESANTEVLRRATLKIDFYMITITGMICVSSLTLALFLLLGAHLPSRSFVIHGECLNDRTP
jgi:hypothetical protein